MIYIYDIYIYIFVHTVYEPFRSYICIFPRSGIMADIPLS